MPSFICAECNKDLNCYKNEAVFIRTNRNGKPISLWFCDVYECPKCRKKVALGFAKRPFATVLEDDDFEQSLEHYKDDLITNL